MNYQIEMQRNNTTPAQFFATVKSECKKKGIDFSIKLDEFKNPNHICSNRYYIKGDKKICYNDGYRSEWPVTNEPCKSEILVQSPYEYQTYILNFDGSVFNEICEFTFDSQQHGHGYYYQINRV